MSSLLSPVAADMPTVLEHIDAIARQKQRDVLYLTFFDDPQGKRTACEWPENATRAHLIEWLDAHGITWRECGEIANPNVMRGYRGSIYIDVCFDLGGPVYPQLVAFLELPDGTVSHNALNGKNLSVDWDADFEPATIYSFTYRKTIERVNKKKFAQYIRWIFDGEQQPLGPVEDDLLTRSKLGQPVVLQDDETLP